MNKAFLVGRLGKDAEVKEFGDGLKCVSVALATHDRYKTPQGEIKEVTEWHNLKLWGNRWDNLVPYLKTGKQIACIGKIKYRKNETPSGTAYFTDIEVSELDLLGEVKPSDPTAGTFANQPTWKPQPQMQPQMQPQPQVQTTPPTPTTWTPQNESTLANYDEALPF